LCALVWKPFYTLIHGHLEEDFSGFWFSGVLVFFSPPFFLCSSFGFGFVCVGLSLTSLMTSTMRVTLSKAGRFSFCAISRLRDLS
jgi:hypothetical protein